MTSPDPIGEAPVPDWLTWVLLFSAACVGLFAFGCLLIHLYYRFKFLDQVVRIFQEKPLFVIPRGDPDPTAEDVTFPTTSGLSLRGCYLRHRTATRRGVILFGLEFGSDRWAAVTYCDRLRDAGYDVFAYEPRNQGESDTDPAYAPLQWVTDRDVADGRAAVAYLKARPDADPRGFGVFGISKGGSLGLLLAAEDAAVQCVATDGAFATYTTVVPYMRRWVSIYSPHRRLQQYAPDFLYGSIGLAAMRRVERKRGVRFPWVESAARRLTVPVFMIHGEADTYIKPDMAKSLYAKCKSKVKELWLVPKAKHNQAPQVDPERYHAKLIQFFKAHCGRSPTSAVDTPTPHPVDELRMPTNQPMSL
jgi:pimeloyl-ACP methyl ester carboxylesterase